MLAAMLASLVGMSLSASPAFATNSCTTNTFPTKPTFSASGANSIVKQATGINETCNFTWDYNVYLENDSGGTWGTDSQCNPNGNNACSLGYGPFNSGDSHGHTLDGTTINGFVLGQNCSFVSGHNWRLKYDFRVPGGSSVKVEYSPQNNTPSCS